MINLEMVLSRDLLHLLKGGRSHLLNHIICLDPETMKCVNMSMYEVAAKLSPLIRDRLNIISMKDGYALELFVWQTFTRLLSEQRFNGCFYNISFLFMRLAAKIEDFESFQSTKIAWTSDKNYLLSFEKHFNKFSR